MPTDAPRVEPALLVGAAQILFLDVPDHAAVDLSVRLVQADRRAGRYSGLVNAVLRRVAQSGREMLAELDAAKLDAPEWLMARWTSAYGAETARAIARANAQEPALDLTVKTDARGMGGAPARRRAADRLGAHGRAWAGLAAAGIFRRRVVGAGRRRRDCRRDCSATCAASASPTSARRRAARPRSSPRMGAQVTAVDRSERRLAAAARKSQPA